MDCPPPTIQAIEQPAPYYVYAPNLPAGYTHVLIDHPDGTQMVVTLPPPGVYGTEGDTVRVCYTDDIYQWAADNAPQPPEPPPDPEPVYTLRQDPRPPLRPSYGGTRHVAI